jgi:beta-lactamase regulating signal transducer with metallopeptidase domain
MHALVEAGLNNSIMAGVIALAAFTLSRLCRRPALTHALWLLVLLKLVTPPLVRVPISWPEPSPVENAATFVRWSEPVVPLSEPAPVGLAKVEANLPDAARPEEDIDPVGDDVFLKPEPALAPAAQDPVCRVVGNGPGADNPFSWFPLVILAWALGTVLWLALAALRLGRFQSVLAHAGPAPEELQAEADMLARRLGMARAPGVWLVPGVLSPMLWAMGRWPRLLLPGELLERLGDEQRQALLVHELAHLRRRDHWIRWLELVVLALYWWLPVAWWARRELQDAEEECCDAWVVWALPRSAKAYAVALVETLDFLAEARPALPVAASGLGHLSSLRRRLTMIMRGETPRALTRVGLLTVLGLGLLLLPLVPSLAQVPGPSREPEEQQGPDQRNEEQQRLQILRRLQAEVEQAHAEVEAHKAALDQKMKVLDMRLRELQVQKKRLADEAGGRAQGGKPGRPATKEGSGQMMAGGIRPDIERRLAEMERKLDAILREVKGLRQPRGFGAGPGGGQGGRPGGPANVPQGGFAGGGAGFAGGGGLGGNPPRFAPPGGGFPGGPGGAGLPPGFPAPVVPQHVPPGAPQPPAGTVPPLAPIPGQAQPPAGR